MSDPQRILVVCTRRIGDVLLATPAVRSLARRWPQAQIDMLVFSGTAGVLEGNPDLARVIAVPERSRWRERLGELRRLWRSYDLAVSVVPSDRARLYGRAAARRHVGTFDPVREPKGKRWQLDHAVPFDDIDTHTVAMGVAIAAAAGAPAEPEVVAPTAGGALPAGVSGGFAVLHPYPKFNYKMWTEAGWCALAEAVRARGMAVWLTGSPDAAERAYCERIAAASGARSLAGTLSLAQTADLLRAARLFVGPDTAVTHIAAACGTPTVALFGPSNPVKWGPWPAGWSAPQSPWALIGSRRAGNVYLLQGEADCVPCRLEGCDRHVASWSRCLQELALARVLAAVDAMLHPA